MSAVLDLRPDPFVSQLLQPGEPLPALRLAAAAAVRAQGASAAARLPWPTARDEEWRFTDVSPLRQQVFEPAAALPDLTSQDIAPFILPEACALRLVFVDGIYAETLSAVTDHGPVVLHALAPVLNGRAEPKLTTAVEAELGRHAHDHLLFAALNSARLQEGALVIVPPGTSETPIHLLFLNTQRAQAQVTYPRCLVVVDPGSRATVIEDYVGLGEGPYFTDAVTEVSVGEGGHLRHIRLQREGAQAFHMGHTAITLARDSHYWSNTVAFGGRLTRHDLHVNHKAPGAYCALNGLVLIADRQLADTHTLIDHAQPHGNSEQLHKCIVDGSARAVFNGKIVVRKAAQQISARQGSHNLLLSPRARVDAKPELQIHADDVKCTHGATVGQLEQEELFYLQSRGLSLAAARSLLTYAFAAEVVERLPVASLREALSRLVWTRAQTLSQTVPPAIPGTAR